MMPLIFPSNLDDLGNNSMRAAQMSLISIASRISWWRSAKHSLATRRIFCRCTCPGFLGIASLFAVQAWAVEPSEKPTPLKEFYTAEGDAFVGHNVGRFNNRPLYGNQNSAIVVTGDRPMVRFGNGGVLNGTVILALVRGGQAKWIHDWSDITCRYRTNTMEWTLRDAGFGPTVLNLTAVTPAEGAGMAMRLTITDGQAGDELIWVCGGSVVQKQSMVNMWDVTTHGREKILSQGFATEDCLGDQITIANSSFTIRPNGNGADVAIGQCSVPGRMVVADARLWADPLALRASSATDSPLLCASIPLAATGEIFWSMVGAKARDLASLPALTPAEKVFSDGLQRSLTIGKRVVVDTPDSRLNTMVAASNTVTDAVFRDGIFTHSGMRWGIPLIGWRCIFGGTAYGWHDRVKTEAKICLAKQITESTKTKPSTSPQNLLTCQDLESRMFGKGRVNIHQTWHYDMQSQFFDQLIHAWRWTGDAELEKILRPALELHLEYIHDCFDPDDDGLYESYATSWPTDNQWYNGGGTTEESAYAYNAHKAARDLARRAGDEASVQRHESRLAKIHTALMSRMWIPEKGYLGAYVEQGGHERLHEDSWLYSIFCPIDAGMLDVHQAVQALYYTEWGLEREKMPYGGERCWTSNWVPSVWSLREMWPGDCYQLALAYFQTGLADEGWNLLRGTYPRMAFYGPVPGDFGHPNGGTDFNDCASMFCRTVVEGLFGYRPDYPNGIVTFAPQLPSTWDHGSISTPDVRIEVNGNRYHIELTQPAALDLRLPMRAGKLAAVTVNGKPMTYELLPGFGCSLVKISLPKSTTAQVELMCEQPVPQFSAISVTRSLGDVLSLIPSDATVVEPAVLPTHAGSQVVEARVMVGSAPQVRLFKVTTRDAAAEQAITNRSFATIPEKAAWETLDLSPIRNGDIRTIFKQRYLSPRPDTCSLRLGTDGYTTWQGSLGANPKPAPNITLDQVPGLMDGAGRLRTPQGVPFAWSESERNIAFTSMWDNWPRQVTLPVNRKADGIWLLMCGSTNPMQGRIANAEITLRYADGSKETLALIPPLNFWSLCHFGGADYNYQRDSFSLPKEPPQMVQLGANCRAILINQRLKSNTGLTSVTLETLSQEVIIGLMGASLLNPH